MLKEGTFCLLFISCQFCLRVSRFFFLSMFLSYFFCTNLVDRTSGDALFSEFSTHSPGSTSSTSAADAAIILNADAVYLTAYCTLQLGLRLCKEGAYASPDTSKRGQSSSPTTADPVSRGPSSNAGDRQRFVDSVLSSGLLVFASPTWLAEVYETVSEVDALGLAARYFCEES